MGPTTRKLDRRINVVGFVPNSRPSSSSLRCPKSANKRHRNASAFNPGVPLPKLLQPSPTPRRLDVELWEGTRQVALLTRSNLPFGQRRLFAAASAPPSGRLLWNDQRSGRLCPCARSPPAPLCVNDRGALAPGTPVVALGREACAPWSGRQIAGRWVRMLGRS